MLTQEGDEFKIEFFVEKISNSGKKALNMLRLEAMSGVRSVTGSNYRHNMLLLGKNMLRWLTVPSSPTIG